MKGEQGWSLLTEARQDMGLKLGSWREGCPGLQSLHLETVHTREKTVLDISGVRSSSRPPLSKTQRSPDARGQLLGVGCRAAS